MTSTSATSTSVTTTSVTAVSSSIREDVEFLSAGTRIAAYHYFPQGVATTACVVMAHGFTATRDQALPEYATRLARAGMHVVLFDYRYFGASGGEPRQLLDIKAQHADFRAAIGYARGLEGVDPEKIVLFGSSFSGGHVVAVAATDSLVAAVVAQVPFADGFATLLTFPPKITAWLTVKALQDQVGSWLGRPPVLVPCVGEPGSLATLTAPEAKPGFYAINPENSLWRNEFAARLMLRIALYRPISVAKTLHCPLLVCVADDDATVPPKPGLKMGSLAPQGEVVHYPLGHFEVYLGEPFERAIADELDFLRRHGLAT